MKKCKACGAKMQDWHAACPKCRAMYGETQPQQALGASGAGATASAGVAAAPRLGGGAGVGAGAVQHRPGKVSPLALAALVSAFACGGIISIPLGIVALRQINAQPEVYGGRGYAYAAIAIGGLVLLFAFVMPMLAAVLGADG